MVRPIFMPAFRPCIQAGQTYSIFQGGQTYFQVFARLSTVFQGGRDVFSSLCPPFDREDNRLDAVGSSEKQYND